VESVDTRWTGKTGQAWTPQNRPTEAEVPGR
jgi:hypothetical protein